MTGAEQLFWAEVSSEKSTRRSVAVCYALLIAVFAGEGGDFWRPVNNAVNERFGLTNVRQQDSFRKIAWDIHGAASKRGRLAP